MIQQGAGCVLPLTRVPASLMPGLPLPRTAATSRGAPASGASAAEGSGGPTATGASATSRAGGSGEAAVSAAKQGAAAG